MQRYRSWNGKRGIHAYQVWNEANVVNFWTGTTLQMAQLTKATRNAVKAQDKDAIVVGPAFAARIGEQIRGITRFAFARVNGVPAWKFADVISLNLYPLPKYGTKLGTPEYSMTLLARRAQAARLRRSPGVEADLEHRGQLRHADRQPRRHAGDQHHGRAPGGVRAADLPAQRAREV